MKRLIMVLASALACVAATLAMALPAQAAPAQPASPGATNQPAAGPNCPSDALCLYTDVNYGGTQIRYTGDGKDCRIDGFVNKISSAINNRNDKAVLYKDRGCTNPGLTVKPGERIPNFVNRGFNDKTNGVKLF